jgi:hypothetical protein
VTASKQAGYTLSNATLSSTDGMVLGLHGFSTANLTDTTGGHGFTMNGWTGTGSLTDSAATPDTIAASKSAGFTLTNTSLASSDGMTLGISGFSTANLTDTGSGHSFTITGWTGHGTLKGTSETLIDQVSANVVLANGSLAVAGLPALALNGFSTANLTDTSGGHTLTVSGWTGTGSLTDSASTADTVRASKKAGYTLSNNALSSTDGMVLSLSNFARANLTDTAGGHTVTVSGWTGAGFLTDSAATKDTINASKNAGFTLSNTLLQATDGMSLSLSGFTKANLTDTAGGNSFSVGSWRGTGSLIDSAATADTVKASKQAGYTLSNTALSATDGMVLNLSNFAKANLTDTSGGHTVTVSGWTGTGVLSDTAATTDTVFASKSAGMTLSNSSLKSTDGMALSLSGFTTAKLTALSTSGQPDLIVDASKFTGTTHLAAGGSGTSILLGGSGNGGSLTTVGTGNNILIGGAGADTLTDTSGKHNILIGGGGSDTITGNGKDILISGTTSYDSNTSANIAALDAILAEWSSIDSYAVRISKISKGITVGSHTYELNQTTVQPDAVASSVSDGSAAIQNNWFIVSSQDHVTKKANETETIIN